MPLNRSNRFDSKRFFSLFLLFLIVACQAPRDKAEDPKKRPTLVRVFEVLKRDVPIQVSAIGSAEPFSSVSVRAQQGGELQRVCFRQGQDVKKGDLLFQLDARLQEAALRQSQANLSKDAVQARNALAQFKRYEALYREGGVSPEQFEQLRANLTAFQATVAADRALLDNARTQLSYSRIYSPIDGRTGSLLVNEGNIVKANDANPLVVINQIKPIYVSFNLPQQDFALLQRYRAAGSLGVSATPRDGGKPAEGKLSFLDNAIDSTTGTIRLKATFGNQDQRLWPGQFVDVSLTLSHQRDALLVPSKAVQVGQKGKYVFVLKPDRTVNFRPVTVSRSFQEFDVVENGLKAGEKVVTDGLMQLTEGARVKVAKK